MTLRSMRAAPKIVPFGECDGETAICEDYGCGLCCEHGELDHGICMDCGADMSDELAARAEFYAELAADR